MLNLPRRAFEAVVSAALDGIPDRFHDLLENVAIVVREEPTAEELADVGLDPAAGDELFGLYVGVSLLDRDASSYSGLPDQVYIFRGPILRCCTTVDQVRTEIRDTVIHELGHHMGLSDEEMPY